MLQAFPSASRNVKDNVLHTSDFGQRTFPLAITPNNVLEDCQLVYIRYGQIQKSIFDGVDSNELCLP